MKLWGSKATLTLQEVGKIPHSNLTKSARDRCVTVPQHHCRKCCCAIPLKPRTTFTFKSLLWDLSQSWMKSWGLLLKLSIKSLSVFSWLMYSIVSWICRPEQNKIVSIEERKVLCGVCLAASVLPSSLVQQSPAGWWWRTGNYSSGSSVGRPPPHQCHSMLSSSDQPGPHCSEQNITDKLSQPTQGLEESTHTEVKRNIWLYLRDRHTCIPDCVIDDYGVGMLQQTRQFHGNFSKSHASTAKDLNSRVEDESLINLECLFPHRIIKKTKQFTY